MQTEKSVLSKWGILKADVNKRKFFTLLNVADVWRNACYIQTVSSTLPMNLYFLLITKMKIWAFDPVTLWRRVSSENHKLETEKREGNRLRESYNKKDIEQERVKFKYCKIPEAAKDPFWYKVLSINYDHNRIGKNKKENLIRPSETLLRNLCGHIESNSCLLTGITGFTGITGISRRFGITGENLWEVEKNFSVKNLAKEISSGWTVTWFMWLCDDVTQLQCVMFDMTVWPAVSSVRCNTWHIRDRKQMIWHLAQFFVSSNKGITFRVLDKQ